MLRLESGLAPRTWKSELCWVRYPRLANPRLEWVVCPRLANVVPTMAEASNVAESERAHARRTWLAAKLGGQCSYFELSRTNKISYNGLRSWLNGKLTNQTPTLRGKLVKALSEVGVSCAISEIPG